MSAVFVCVEEDLRSCLSVVWVPPSPSLFESQRWLLWWLGHPLSEPPWPQVSQTSCGSELWGVWAGDEHCWILTEVYCIESFYLYNRSITQGIFYLFIELRKRCLTLYDQFVAFLLNYLLFHLSQKRHDCWSACAPSEDRTKINANIGNNKVANITKKLKYHIGLQ